MSLTRKFQTVALAIFPSLENKKGGVIDLRDLVRAMKPRTENPFLNARLTDRFMAAVHRKMGVDYSVGGYLEDRSVVLRDSYIDPAQAIHMGIDVTVPAGTAVAVTRPCRVVKIIHDKDQDGGWGTVVMLELDEPEGRISHFLYAHLAKDSVPVKEGDRLTPGTVIGHVGKTHENGGWWEHLHVQAMTRECWDRTRGELAAFDGYGPAPQQPEHPDFPDPFPLLT